jgi:hypothetical protein
MSLSVSIVRLKHFWGYVIPWVANRTEEKSLCVQRDFRYGDFGSHRVLRIGSRNFIMMMLRFTSLSDDDAVSKIFQTQYTSLYASCSVRDIWLPKVAALRLLPSSKPKNSRTTKQMLMKWIDAVLLELFIHSGYVSCEVRTVTLSNGRRCWGDNRQAGLEISHVSIQRRQNAWERRLTLTLHARGQRWGPSPMYHYITQ